MSTSSQLHQKSPFFCESFQPKKEIIRQRPGTESMIQMIKKKKLFENVLQGGKFRKFLKQYSK